MESNPKPHLCMSTTDVGNTRGSNVLFDHLINDSFIFQVCDIYTIYLAPEMSTKFAHNTFIKELKSLKI